MTVLSTAKTVRHKTTELNASKEVNLKDI